MSVDLAAARGGERARMTGDPDRDGKSARLGGMDPFELASRFGTPLFVYDFDLIDRQLNSLRAVVPTTVDIAYAVKANPSLAVLAHFGASGVGSDVASGGEREA